MLRIKTSKTKEYSLFSTSLLVSFATLLSRILGLIRDIILAKFFGVSELTESFFIAFKIPNFWRRLFAEGAFTQAFVPVLAKYNNDNNPEQIKVVINTILSYLIITLFCLTIIVLIFPKFIIYLFASGLSHTQLDLATQILRFTFPYLLFLSLCAFFNAILNYHKIYFLPSLTPIGLNLTLILGILISNYYFEVSIMLLGYLVCFAGLIQLIFVLSVFFIKGFRFKISLNKHPALKSLINLIMPNLLTISFTQISLLINLSIASYLVVGSITWLYYAERLLELPAGILSVTIATIILPKMATSFTKNKLKKLSSILNWSITYILLLGIPASFSLFYLAPQIVSTLFYYGKFTLNDLNNTAMAVQAYMIGLPFLLLIKVLNNTFFSMYDSKTPMKIAIISIIINIILSLILSYFFSFIGLAIATSISNFIHCLLQLYFLNKKNIMLIGKKFIKSLLKIIFSSIFMCILLEFIIKNLSSLNTLDRITNLTLYICIGLLSYFICLYLLKFNFIQLLKRKF